MAVGSGPEGETGAMSGKKYSKVKIKTETGTKWIWSCGIETKGKMVTIKQCKSDGDEWYGSGSSLHVVIGHVDDVLEIKPAKMNLKYGTLEVE